MVMTPVAIFGFLAAGFWLAAAATSFRINKLSLNFGEPPEQNDRDNASIDFYSHGEIRVSGMRVPTYNEMSEYLSKLYLLNKWGSLLNGMAALFACVAAILTFWPA